MHRRTDARALLTMLVALCRGVGIECPVPAGWTLDDAVLAAVTEALPAPAALADMGEVAELFAERIDSFDPDVLLQALQLAEDRAGAVCAADPRPSMYTLADADALASPRATALVGYLLSDDHLAMRRGLGYLADVSMPHPDGTERRL